MSDSDFNHKFKDMQRQIGKIQQLAAKKPMQLEAVLPKALNNLQSTLIELQEQVEKALRGSEECYQQLLDSVTDFTYSYETEQGRTVSSTYSPSCVVVTGYTAQEFEANSNLWFQIVYKEDKFAVLEQLAEVLSENDVATLDHRIVHKDGSIRWVSHILVHRYKDNRLIGYDGLVADITVRKQLEGMLRESEIKFRTLTETTTAAIFIFGKSQNRYVNPAAEAITGYTKEELLKMKYWAVIHPEFQDLVKERGLARQEGKNVPAQYELKVLTKGGEIRWVECTLGVIKYEGERATIGTAFDITDRKQAETERERLLLAEREQRIRAETLGETFLALTSKISHEAVLDEILHQVQHLFPDNATNITLLQDDTLHVVRWQGYQAFDRKDVITNLVQPLAELPLDTEVIQSRQPLIISDTRQNSNWVIFGGFTWIRSSISVPICLRDQVLGLLRLDSDIPSQLTAKDTKYLRPLADAAAIALENARLYGQIQIELDGRMHTEKELRRVTTRQQAILNAIPDSMIYLNRKGKILSYKLVDNRNLLAGAAMPIIAGTSSNFLEASLHDLIKHHIDKLFDSGEPQSFEYQLARSENVQDFEVRLVASGPNETLAMIRNITKHKQAELALADERNLLRTVIDNLPDYIFAKDIKGRYLINNKAHLKILDVATPDEASGKSPSDFFAPEDTEQFTTDDRKVLQMGQPILNKEGFITDKQGNEIWRSISKVPLRDAKGKIIGLVSIGKDISERRQVEEQLRKLSLAVEQSPSIVIITDTKGIVEYVNPKFSQLTGYTPAEIMGKNPRILKLGELSQEVYKQLWKMITSGNEWRGEFHNKKKNGEFYWVSASISPIKDSKGEITHFLAVQEDITERKRVEEALLRSETNLRTIFDNSQQAFVLVDRIYTIQASNRMAKVGIRLISGRTIKEGNSIHNYVPKTDLEEFNRGFDEALDGISVRQEKRVNLGGKVRWFEISYNPVFADHGQVIGVCFSAVDIDERKRAVEKLAASEKRLWEEMRSMLATTRALVSEININNLLEFIMSQAKVLMDAEQAAVLLLNEDGQHLEIANPTESILGIRKGSSLPIQGSLAGLAMASHQIQRSNEVDDSKLLPPMLSFLQLSRAHSLLCAPLIFQRNKLGVLVAWNKREKNFSMSNKHLVEMFADQAALALYNAKLHAQNRLLAIEQERHRMARNLHDSVTQSLYSIGLAAQTSMRLFRQDKITEIQEPLDYIHLLSQTALAEMRQQIFHLRTTDLDREDLVEVLKKHCHTLSIIYGLDIKFTANLASLPPIEQREAFYFMAREALWNVIKHAKANQVTITLQDVNKYIRLTIEDDGIGFNMPLNAKAEMMGLRNMQERTESFQGTFDLESEPGHGTRLTVQIPN